MEPINVTFNRLFIEENIKLLSFYPYTSRVREVIAETTYFDKDDHWLRPIWKKMKKLLREWEERNNRLVAKDNKTVIKFSLPSHSQYFIGYYDGRISLGREVEQHKTYRSTPTSLHEKKRKYLDEMMSQSVVKDYEKIDPKTKEIKIVPRRYYPLKALDPKSQECFNELFMLFFGYYSKDKAKVNPSIIFNGIDTYVEIFEDGLWVRTIYKLDPDHITEWK